MKTLKKYLLPILIVIAFAILMIFSNKNNKEIPQQQVSVNEVSKVCYLYEQEQVTSDDTMPLYDREYIELGFNGEFGVTGVHNILPAEKDANRANIVGVSDGTFVNVIATANAEGQKWQEQRLYKLENDRLYVGYQPIYVPQYKNENDIYMYEDLNKLIFDTDKFYLDKIDCNLSS